MSGVQTVGRDGPRSAARRRPDDSRPGILTDMLTWQPSGAEERLLIDLGALFSEALGE